MEDTRKFSNKKLEYQGIKEELAGVLKVKERLDWETNTNLQDANFKS